METFILLSLSVLIGILILFAFGGVPFLPITWRKSIIDEPVVRKEPSRIFIPDVLARWPWPRRLNPNYAVAKKEADAWMMSFRAFNPKAQDAYNRCNCSLLACLTCPLASKEHARAGCDVMHMFLTIDEYSDRSAPSEVRKQKDVVMDALRNPHMPRSKGEWIGGEVTRQFWERTIQNATAVSQKRFIRNMDLYLEGVVQQSINKKDHRILDVQSYIDLRRLTSGVKPAFSMIEWGLDIPDKVMSHAVIQELFLAAGDLVAFTNDIFSYNLEQLRGEEVHNIITCVMNEFHTDVNGAILWVEHYLRGVMERFRVTLDTLPQWEEPLNSQVKEYCDGLGHWVRGHDQWNFESGRYFGNKGLEIMEHRWMSLLPKDSASATQIGPVHIDSSRL